MPNNRVVIIGAGPSGLGAGYELSQETPIYKGKVLIVEKNNSVGGLARTIDYKGFQFDVGPHRFYTKNDYIQKLWENLLKKDFIKVDRLTRMFYKNKFFLYPIVFGDLIKNFSIYDLYKIGTSWMWSKISDKNKNPNTFEEWTIKQFGSKLYKTFFKTYTEKVWGIDCKDIGAEWAAQRIKNLNFLEVISSALSQNKFNKAKSLVSEFYYPVKGAGMMYKKMAKIITESGIKIDLNSSVVEIAHSNFEIKSVKYLHNGTITVVPTDYLFSSMPMTHFVESLNPKPPTKILNAAKKLFFRDHITVNFIYTGKKSFPDNWIYVHSPEVKIARITNYRNFSKQMSPSGLKCGIGVEYFCFENDEIWRLSDDELISFARKELDFMKLIDISKISDGFVIRELDAYPTYYLGYSEYFELIKKWCSNFSNLQLIGRGGMYRYNNQDHALYSGILAAKNFKKRNSYNLWEINEDAEYLESKKV